MKKLTTTIILSGLLLAAQPVMAAIKVFSCEPEWKSLVEELGQDRVKVYSATTAFQDPHHIEARPSLIAKVRRAKLVICSGSELETGWLPVLLRQAGNANVLPGKPGYFEASSFVKRLEIPGKVDRSLGDVHASGNPHVHLDPRRIATIAKVLSQRLIALDPDGSTSYTKNYQTFATRWQAAIQGWQQQAKPLNAVGVVVHHKDWVYMFDWLNIKNVGALEPKPGLPTTVGHLVELKNQLKVTPAKMVIHTKYQNARAAKRFAQMASIPVVELPYTVGGDDNVKDLFSLFDVTIKKLLGALK